MGDHLERLLALADIQIPPTLLKNAGVKVLFKDGNSDNWDISNLAYTFENGPLECPFYPDHYYIPGFSKYVINRTAEIIVVKTALKRKWWKVIPGKDSIRGGYHVLAMRSDFGTEFRLYRHRAVCLAFKELKIHPALLQVNHLNGVGGDDREENLEFCTAAENIKHAYSTGLFANKVVEVDALNWKTGEQRSYPTITECVKDLKLSYEKIWHRLSRGNERRYSDGWRFKRRNDVWLDLNKREGNINSVRSILFRHAATGQTFIVDAIVDACKITGVGHNSIQRQCCLKPFVPLNGWNFRYMDDFEGWPQYTEQHLLVFEKYPVNAGAAVEVYDIETNQILFFTSMKEASVHFGISPITVAKLARHEATRQKRYKFKMICMNND